MRRFLLVPVLAPLFATPALAQPQSPNALLLKGQQAGWGWNCPQQSAVIQEAQQVGLPVTIVDPVAWASEDFFDYTMIFLEDCQNDATYNAWNARIADLHAWVDSGGFLAVHATRNCSGATVQADIPGGTPTRTTSSAANGNLSDPAHPILVGLGNPAWGNWLAHDEYPNTGNASDTALLTNSGNGNALLFERWIGRGVIIYGGLTYSCYVGGCGGCVGAGPAGDAGKVVKNEVDWGSTFTLCGTIDSDGDGIGDVCDVCPFDPLDDKDHDGICDSSDACPRGSNFVDTDGDGTVDGCDPCPIDNPDDADGDGTCDSCPEGNHDHDGDGVWACLDNCPWDPNTDQFDDDGDGVGDACDVCPNGDDFHDTDGDGVPDGCDNCPHVASDDQTDPDKDGYGTPCDVCPNGDDRLDSDGDGVPDDCDRCHGHDDAIDGDEDGIPDACDNCLVVRNPSQRDQDADGVGEACDCDDLDPHTAPNRPEFCDGLDNDCDGEIDENATDADEYYLDADYDGFGDPDTSILTCRPPVGWSIKPRDCDDTNPGIHPHAVEICDGRDNDCDGVVDGPHCDEPAPGQPVAEGSRGCSTAPALPTGALALLLGGLLLTRRRT